MSSDELNRVLEAYVLAADDPERKRLKDELIPGSETHMYLTILEQLKELQADASRPFPDDLKKTIEVYNKKYSRGASMFKLREKLLVYDRADQKGRKKMLDDIAKNDLYLTSAWNFQPPVVKKVVGQESEKRRLPSAVKPDFIPSKEDIVKSLHGQRSNFLGVS